MSIFFKGLRYRDERIFVMDFKIGTIHSKRGKEEKYILTTFRNTNDCPPIRSDKFSSKKELFKYIRCIEPDTPLISFKGKSLPIPSGENRWHYWSDWLTGKKLPSAISGLQIIPKRWMDEGVTSYKYEVLEISKEELIKEGLLYESKSPFDEQDLINKGLLFTAEDEEKYQ